MTTVVPTPPTTPTGPRRNRSLPYLLIAPTMVLIGLVVLVPVVQTIWLSVHDATIRETGPFNGVANFAEMFADPSFLSALGNTVTFTVTSVVIELGLGVALAMIIHQQFLARGAVRAIALLPWAFPTAIAAVMFRLMLSDDIGIIAWLAKNIGLVDGPILGSQGSLVVAAVIVDIWKTTPFVALLILAGLQTIPGELTEAASIDGATGVQRFLRITLPLLVPSLLVAALFRTLDAYRAYELFWVMGNRQVDSLSTYVFEGVRVSQLQFGPGSAGAVFTFVTAFAIALFFVILLGRRSRES